MMVAGDDAPYGLHQWVRAELERRGLSPLKRRGQHFLADTRIIRRMTEAIVGDECLPVLEIGPGLGALTGALLARGCAVLAVEVDRGLAQYLRDAWGASTLLHVEVADARARVWSALWEESGLPTPLVVAGNLPYYLTGPLVARLWEDEALLWRRAVFMVQKEVRDRILATPGTPGAGAVSVLIRAVGQPRGLLTVPPAAFYPRPQVTSAVFVVERHAAWPREEVVCLRRLVRAGFGQRRKTLRQALKSLGDPDPWLAAVGLDASRRAESLSLEEWHALTRAVIRLGPLP
jgi:16S rRNA (adenine1518-N6/adenine1519-N6)-dimethyltransferase